MMLKPSALSLSAYRKKSTIGPSANCPAKLVETNCSEAQFPRALFSVSRKPKEHESNSESDCECFDGDERERRADAGSASVALGSPVKKLRAVAPPGASGGRIVY